MGSTVKNRAATPGASPASGGLHSARPQMAVVGDGLQALLLGGLICLTISVALHWPLPLHLTDYHTISNFNDSHVWAFDQMARMVVGNEPFSVTTFAAGYPGRYPAPFIGWVPALLAMPFRGLLGPIGAFHIVLLLTPLLTWLATHVFLRKVTQSPDWVVAAAALLYTFSPFALTTIANGQIEKSQLWAYPLHLYLLWCCLEGPRRWLALLGIPLVSLGMVFSDPYFGLILPLAATPLAAAKVFAAKGHRVRTGAWAFLALSLTAISLAPAQIYYAPHTQKIARTIFTPATPDRPRHGRIASRQSSMAQPFDTFIGRRPRDENPWHNNHTTYLMMAVWLGALLLLPLRARGRWVGLALVLIGLTIAAGPKLVIGDVYQTWRGHPYVLPLEYLLRLGYPLRFGGMYYRAIALASLGLALIIAAGLGRLRRDRAIVVAWLLVAIGLGDGLLATGPHWPRPVVPIRGLELISAMRGDRPDGAVVSLPLQGQESLGGYHLMLSAIHGRPTTAVPRYLFYGIAANQHYWAAQFNRISRAGNRTAARSFLRGMGFRYVLMAGKFDLRDGQFGLTRPELEALLGAPTVQGPIWLWDLGPTRLRPVR